MRALGSLAVLSILCVCSPADAQDPAAASAPPAEVESIEIIGRSYLPSSVSSSTKTDTPLVETPQSISVITRDLLDARNTSTLAEALRYQPGVRSEPFGFEPRFTFLRIRGLDSTTTGLFRDGLQLRNPDFAVSYIVEPFAVESIEVPRGPAGSLYGQSPAGGLVNYISKRPTSDPQRLIELELGNHNRVESKLDIGGAIDSAERLLYRFTALSRDSDTQVDEMEDDRTYLAPALSWHPGDATSITLLSMFQKDETLDSQALPAAGTLESNPAGEIPIRRFTGERGLDRVERTEYSTGYVLDHSLSDRFRLGQTFRYNKVELDDVVVFSNGIDDDQRTLQRGAFGKHGDLNAYTLDTRAVLDFDAAGAAHQLLLGFDYQRYDVDAVGRSGTAPPIDLFGPRPPLRVELPAPFQNDEARQSQRGVYVQDRITVLDRFILTLGGRVDRARSEVRSKRIGANPSVAPTKTNQTDSMLTGRAALSYRAGWGVVPYVSYATSFLPILGANANGAEWKPEQGRQVEVGLKLQPEGIGALFSLAFFDLERENFVERDRVTQLQVQRGLVRSRGYELELVGKLAEGLDVTASFTYTHVEDDQFQRRLTQTPEKYGAARIEYALQSGPLAGLSLGLGVRYSGATYADVENRIRVPGYTLTDVGIHYDWREFRFGLDVQNLADKEYVSSCFVRSDDSFCTFGETRSVRATLGYRW